MLAEQAALLVNPLPGGRTQYSKGIIPDPENNTLTVEKYDCCSGVNFKSFEDVRSDILIGFLRLRFPHDPHRLELQNTALVENCMYMGPCRLVKCKKSVIVSTDGY